jgi:hypothetical protein
MRTTLAIVAALALAASTALATAPITDEIRNTLSQIDAIPTQTQLNRVLGSDAETGLSSIARDGSIDIGVRLRAIHGLGKYCEAPCPVDDEAHLALTDLITQLRDDTSEPGFVLLRAAIETVGTMKVSSDEPLLAQLLDHPSRDIRTAVARALRDLCSSQANTPLRVRYVAEPTEQVKLAISEALRILQQCGQ